MDSSTIENSLQQVFSDSLWGGVKTALQVIFFSPWSILIYGGIAILIIHAIVTKQKKKK